ncbi:hypothetical protein J7J47_10880 [Halomonas sp. ISL-60]|uniref:ATP-grasp domain-containing protein n=1 Tax=Halomonas sp. ISL-56 TaxID=2819149 RepID=UPI001BEB2759|nr:hypothetical protein [Halomonas sp. ISL-56]MBT2772732.1 hypothetical protein [Halomonas sp. ISL-60]MBT2800527.1 hypothetical protein [Halomonas sp. ISL-56]
MSYVLCFHRWVGAQALYDSYSLPDGLMIRVICTPESTASLPKERLASFSIVDTLDDQVTVQKEVEKTIKKYGIPILVVALNEGDLLTAASVREQFGLLGDHTAWIEKFRDKLKMVDIASRQCSIKVLSASAVDSVDSIKNIARVFGYPLVLKPRYGTASKGVRLVYSDDDIFFDEAEFSEPMMAQVYCSAPILHVDGWWDGQRVIVATTSTYINSCADFGPDSPLGSIEISSASYEDRVINAVSDLMDVFSPQQEVVFHLELFDSGDDLVFLEIGARAGGAEIPFIWREIREIDLVGIAWELQTFSSTWFRDIAKQNSLNGRPISTERGAWIIANSANLIDESISSLYWSLPQNFLAASGVYEGAKTRLRFRDFKYLDLKENVHRVMNKISI